jgi:Fe2+ or Zn2+ uptake regulation protein
LSQQAVFEILQKLGGRATSKQISQLAREMYPQFTLYQYVGNRLRKLQKNGFVKQDKEGYWNIISQYS